MTDREETLDLGRDAASVRTWEDASGSDDAQASEADPEIEAIVVGIETTRAEMSQTVDELGDRLDPGTVVNRAGQAVREATIDKLGTKVNDMTSSASELASNAGQTAQDTGAGIVETIRRNPVPSAMAAIGIGWLVMNRSSARSTYGGWNGDPASRRRMTPTWSGTSRPGDTDWAADVRRRGESVGDAIDDATRAARRTAGDTFDTVGERAGWAADSVSSTANDVVSNAQQALESNPLAFSALAIAVGAAVGMALPATATEKRIMGETGGQLIDRVESAVQQPLQDMEQSKSRTPTLTSSRQKDARV